MGCSHVARTDADTIPASDWTESIATNFQRYPEDLHLLGGSIRALHDTSYHMGDGIMMPLAVKSARIVLAIKHLDPAYLHVVTGANMAVRSDTYEEVGGFVLSSIDTTDEDIAFSLAVAQHKGKHSIYLDPNMIVRTSMRRIHGSAESKGLGWTGTALHHLLPSRRAKHPQQIYIRKIIFRLYKL